MEPAAQTIQPNSGNKLKRTFFRYLISQLLVLIGGSFFIIFYGLNLMFSDYSMSDNEQIHAIILWLAGTTTILLTPFALWAFATFKSLRYSPHWAKYSLILAIIPFLEINGILIFFFRINNVTF
ncbi:MAG: hypothetical protein WCT27_02480 [Patescibacteria group bacterium]